VKVESQHHAMDLHVLRTIVERPECATSLDRLGLGCGQRAATVREAVSRLMRRGWVVPPVRQRQPYLATAEGQRALAGEPRL
jgi:DNA-binding transcriptional regulator PaaX